MLFSNVFLESQIYELSIIPNDTSTYDYADFKIWIDESIDTLEGVYWSIHGFNLDSREIVNNLDYRLITSNKKFALMGARLSSMHMNSGIGDAVLIFMDSISVLSNRPEFSNIPFFINGYSWGGQFGYHFTRWVPDKVLGLISQKGGYHDTSYSNIAINVPMLFFVGENDLQYRIDNLSYVFFNHRRFGAKWSLLVEKNVAHDPINDNQFLNTYFNEVIEMRLSNDIDFYQSVTLNDPIDSSSWLGHNNFYNISSWDCFMNNKDSSSWLISRKIANHWKKFILQSPLLIEKNFDFNQDCQVDIADILFFADILLEKRTNNLFIDFNQDYNIDIYDFYDFFERIHLN